MSHIQRDLSGEKTPTRDKDTYKRLYIEKELTQSELAERLGISSATVSRDLRDYGIKTRDVGASKKDTATYRTHDGYETWEDYPDGETVTVLVHRLAAVAWFGLDVLSEDVVIHHLNEVRWDNREANLSIMTRRGHMTHHTMDGGLRELGDHTKQSRCDSCGRFIDTGGEHHCS